MDILHGRKACHPDVPHGKIRIILIHLDPEDIRAYEAPESEFDRISLDTIIDVNKTVKPERLLQPNVVILTGLADEITKVCLIEPKKDLLETLQYMLQYSRALVKQYEKEKKYVTGLQIFARRSLKLPI